MKTYQNVLHLPQIKRSCFFLVSNLFISLSCYHAPRNEMLCSLFFHETNAHVHIFILFSLCFGAILMKNCCSII